MRRVNGVGPKPAKICIVGEAPGAEEEIEGVPFVGKAGQLLNRLLSGVGIARSQCYITNVVKYRPPNNKMERLPEIGITDIVTQCYPQLRDELMVVRPNVVIPLGNTPLMALTGLSGIKRWRGSILTSTLIPNLKVIPTIHPSAALRGEIELCALISADLARAQKEAVTPLLTSLIDRTYILNPSFEQVITTLERFKSAKLLSVDIEAIPSTNIITEIGLGDAVDFAITIPIFKNRPVWSEEQEAEIWLRVGELLTHPNIGKIVQNQNYEKTQLLNWCGEIKPIYCDTMLAMHLCYCELPKSLAIIGSLFSTMPAWKGDREHEEYNVKDVVATFESAINLKQELQHFNLLKFHDEYQQPFAEVMWKATQRGVRFDLDRQAHYKRELEEAKKPLQDELNKIVGYEVNVRSSKQMAKLLYDELKLPIQRKKGKITADEDALQNLYSKYTHPCLELIMAVRKCENTISKYLSPSVVDGDGRFRTEWVLSGTVTGRLSSRTNIRGTGGNLQNIPKEMRDMFIADDGCVFVIGDESQVEARFVAWLAQDDNYKALFKKGGDIHKEVAAWVFKKDVSMVEKLERQRAKAMAHGAPYGIAAKKISAMYDLPLTEAQWLIDQYFILFPNVRSAYQEGVKQQLGRNRTLISPFGRRRTFFGWWGDDMFREAWASIPQGCAADHINMAAVRMQPQLQDSDWLLIQCHDELVWQGREGDVDRVARLFKSEVEKPILVGGDWMTIPLEIRVGKSWHERDCAKWGG